MIWRAVRTNLVAEFLTCIVFLMLGLVLSALGARFVSPQAASVFGFLWFVVFLVIYKNLVDRRNRRQF